MLGPSAAAEKRLFSFRGKPRTGLTFAKGLVRDDDGGDFTPDLKLHFKAKSNQRVLASKRGKMSRSNSNRLPELAEHPDRQPSAQAGGILPTPSHRPQPPLCGQCHLLGRWEDLKGQNMITDQAHMCVSVKLSVFGLSQKVPRASVCIRVYFKFLHCAIYSYLWSVLLSTYGGEKNEIEDIRNQINRLHTYSGKEIFKSKIIDFSKAQISRRGEMLS